MENNNSVLHENGSLQANHHPHEEALKESIMPARYSPSTVVLIDRTMFKKIKKEPYSNLDEFNKLCGKVEKNRMKSKDVIIKCVIQKIK